jgi:TonB family protein
MQKERKDKHFIKKPVYKGGKKALQAFIKANLRYPEAAQLAGIEGTVTVRYNINRYGKVTSGKIVAGLGHGCDAEALRLIKLLEFQVPKNHVKGVRFQKTLHIHFHLPKVTKSSNLSIQYQLTSSEDKDPDTSSQTSQNGYQYTIRWKG